MVVMEAMVTTVVLAVTVTLMTTVIMRPHSPSPRISRTGNFFATHLLYLGSSLPGGLPPKSDKAVSIS